MLKKKIAVWAGSDGLLIVFERRELTPSESDREHRTQNWALKLCSPKFRDVIIDKRIAKAPGK